MNQNMSRGAGSAFGGKKYLPLFVILIIGTVLRFYHNLDISIWHDEAFSALLVKYNWSEMLYRIGLDVHPPMYYIFLKLWSYLFNNGALALRGFSIFFGVAGIWAAWLFVKVGFKSEKAANWSALLIALNPYIIDFSTEARMYTFGAFFALMAAYFLVKALEEQKQFSDDQGLHMPNLPKDISLRRHYVWHYLAFAIFSGVAILTHYYLLFTAAALCLYGLIYQIYHYRIKIKKYWEFLAACVLIAVSFLPWLKIFIFQVRQVGQGYWIPSMTIWSIPGTLWTILLGVYHNDSGYYTQKILIALFLFSIFFFWRFLKKTGSWAKWLVLLASVFPFLGAIGFLIIAQLKGSGTSVFQERYFLYAGIFYLIALSVWLSEIKIKWLAAGLFVSYALYNLYAFNYHWQGLDIKNKPGMKEAAKYLSANVEAGHHVFVGTSYEFFNYKYYASTSAKIPVRPLLYTGGRSDISQISHVEGVAILTNQDLAPDFNALANKGDTVWLLWTYAFGSKRPEVPGNWVVIEQAEQNQKEQAKEFPDVRPWIGSSIYITQYKVN
jgi:predicted membrane-bound mannosyltransferase